MPVRPWPFIHKPVEYMATHQWKYRFLTYQYTPPWEWHDCFIDPVKSGPTSWVICGLIEHHLSVLIVSQACQTFSMHPQNIWNWWQHIHGLWFQIRTHTTTMMAWWCCISCQSNTTAWVLCGLVGWHFSALIMSQACQTLSMRPWYTLNVWQYIHGLWFHIATHTTMRMFSSVGEVPMRSQRPFMSLDSDHGGRNKRLGGGPGSTTKRRETHEKHSIQQKKTIEKEYNENYQK